MKRAGEPRILLYDLEVSPCIGYTWGKWEQNVIKLISESQIISVAWKFLGEKAVHVKTLRDFPEYKKDPTSNASLIRLLHGLFSQADVTVAHNVKDFDDRVSNTDFLLRGLPPPPPHQQVDTLQWARRYFRFTSNKLDDICMRLGIGHKVRHPGIAMWIGCMHGDRASWLQMAKYNKGDVVLLEKLFLRLRAWASDNPHFTPVDRALLACPVCGSKSVQGRGWARTKAAERQRLQCQDCGKWSLAYIVKRGIRLR